MKITPYIELIRAMPINQQAFWSKRETWLNALESKKLPRELDELFDEDDGWAHISRGDIFNEIERNPQNIKKFIYMTILWGYPSGMRNDYFFSINKRINKLISALKSVRKNGINDWKSHFSHVSVIRGLGLSTYSKILYFMNIKVEGYPPLILDLRLIRVFQEGIFFDFKNLSEITYSNAPNKYPIYLETMQVISNNLDVKQDGLEMFLFTFGDSIKHDCCEHLYGHGSQEKIIAP